MLQEQAKYNFFSLYDENKYTVDKRTESLPEKAFYYFFEYQRLIF